MSEERRHIAILFSDIVGYTSLMGADESKALDILTRNRTIHETHIKQFNGTLIKDIGDAILGSFSLASDAVRCAIEIQKSCKNDGIPLKIGIHEGEVVFKNSDVFGDGVNIASRLQSDAQQGCINISAPVFRDIKNKSDIHTSFIGEKTFKNVDEPIKVYKILCEGEESDHSTTENKPNKIKSKKLYYITPAIVVVVIAILFIWKIFPTNKTVEFEKSIAVLPLKYLSEDQSKQYLADGVLDAITGHLSKIDCLIVRPRTSVEQYRDNNKSAQVIGKELGVSYLIEGSFLMIDNQVKLTIQLINVSDADHTFFKEYDRDYSNIIAVQSEIAKTIAKEIEVAITPETREVIETIPTNNPTAYDLYLHGKEYANKLLSRENLKNSIQMYEAAVKFDSSFALAWVGLAAANRKYYWFYEKQYRGEDKDDFLQNKQQRFAEIWSYLDKAKAIKPDIMEVRREEGAYYYHCEQNYPKALNVFENLSVEYPNDDMIAAYIGYILHRMGEYKKSLKYLIKAKSLNPSNWVHWDRIGSELEILRRYDEAEKYYKKAAELRPNPNGFYYSLYTMYIRSRKIDKAMVYVEDHANELNSQVLMKMKADLFWREGSYEKSILEYENMVSDSLYMDNPNRGFSAYYYLAEKYNDLGQKEKAQENYQKVIEIFDDKTTNHRKNAVKYSLYAISLAGMGMKQQSLDTLDKAMEIFNFSSPDDQSIGQFLYWNKAYILALSGEAEKAFDLWDYFLNKYGGRASVEFLKNEPFWNQFSHMEKFQEIVNNPKYQEIPLP